MQLIDRAASILELNYCYLKDVYEFLWYGNGIIIATISGFSLLRQYQTAYLFNWYTALIWIHYDRQFKQLNLFLTLTVISTCNIFHKVQMLFWCLHSDKKLIGPTGYNWNIVESGVKYHKPLTWSCIFFSVLINRTYDF